MRDDKQQLQSSKVEAITPRPSHLIVVEEELTDILSPFLTMPRSRSNSGRQTPKTPEPLPEPVEEVPFVGTTNVYITLQKANYNPGEVVRGNVYVDTDQEIECERVIVRCSGRESVQWTELNPRKNTAGVFERVKDLLKTESYLFKRNILLAEIQDRIPVGKWVYPFSMELQESLPASCYWEKEDDRTAIAEIVYTFSATFLKEKQYTPEHENSITINVVDKQCVPPPKICEITQQFKCMGIIPTGSLQIAVEFDRGSYTVGDVARVQLQITNNTVTKMDSLVAKVYRVIKLSVDGYFHEFYHVLRQINIDEVNKQDSVLQKKSFLINEPFVPQTSSKYVSCRYYLKIDYEGIELEAPFKVGGVLCYDVGYTPPDSEEYKPPLPIYCCLDFSKTPVTRLKSEPCKICEMYNINVVKKPKSAVKKGKSSANVLKKQKSMRG